MLQDVAEHDFSSACRWQRVQVSLEAEQTVAVGVKQPYGAIVKAENVMFCITLLTGSVC